MSQGEGQRAGWLEAGARTGASLLGVPLFILAPAAYPWKYCHFLMNNALPLLRVMHLSLTLTPGSCAAFASDSTYLLSLERSLAVDDTA